MGCRLHWAKTYRVEWEGGWFNWEAEQVRQIFTELGLDEYIWNVSDQEDDYVGFELSVDGWKKFKNELRKIPQGDLGRPVLGEDYEGDNNSLPITWENLKEWSESVDNTYDSDNDYIRFEWF